MAVTVFGHFAQHGEPIVTRFADVELTAKPKAARISNAAHFPPQADFDRYFLGRHDGLGAPRAVFVILGHSVGGQ